MRRLCYTYHVILLVLTTLLAGGAWTLCFREMPTREDPFRALPWAIGLTFITCFLLYRLYKLNRQYTQQVLFLLDAIENNDYSIHFSEDKRDKDARLVNKALNRITHILHNVKNETAQQEKYYELILECINTGIVVLNDNGAVYQKNNEALRLLGLEVFTHVNQLDRIDPHLTNSFTTCRAGESFQIPVQNERGMLFPDRAGNNYRGYGLYAALSFDEGKTWPVRKLLTDGETRFLNGGAWTRFFLMDQTHAEPRGYMAATQTPDGMIHLVSSRLYYRFNLAWLTN